MTEQVASLSRYPRVAVSSLGGEKLVLDAAASHYLIRVHRLRPGDRFGLFDPEQALEAEARLLSVAERAECEVLRLSEGQRRGVPGLWLLQALGKGDKPERVIRDATALGAARITFVQTERSVVKVGDRAFAKQERWRAIALDAARQSLRSDLPQIDPPAPLAMLLSAGQDGLSLVLDPDAGVALSDALRSPRPERAGGVTAAVALWLGPEGGFSERELQQLEQCGGQRVRLGSLVLRTELAASAALAIASDCLRC